MEPDQPGWYRDPKRPGGRRYWDGHAWVDVDGVSDGPTESRPVQAGPRLIAQRRSSWEDELPAPTSAQPEEIVDDEDAESQAD